MNESSNCVRIDSISHIMISITESLEYCLIHRKSYFIGNWRQIWLFFGEIRFKITDIRRRALFWSIFGTEVNEHNFANIVYNYKFGNKWGLYLALLHFYPINRPEERLAINIPSGTSRHSQSLFRAFIQ